MSLQPGINPLDRRMMPTGVDTGHRSFPNMGGFDPSDLMSRPEIRQEETRNQANMVSAPYEASK